MNGLYALKPWYAARLAAPRNALARRHVHPGTVSWAGVGCASAAATALAALPAGPVAAAAVAVALAGRLACANLDGGLARATGRSTPVGSLVNELSDRLADLVVIAALAAHTTPAWVAAAALGSTLPSWVALAGAAAGAPRVQGGPVGKTERCVIAVVAAGTGLAALACAAVAAGGVVTAAVRLRTVLAALRGGAR